MQRGADIWDAIVVGAGPAGSVAAALLASRGWRILLVDKADWPREKTCGGCLSGLTLNLLSDLGLAPTPSTTAPIHRVNWHVGDRTLTLPSAGAAILRADLDAQLVAAARARGAEFRPSAAATLMPHPPNSPHRLVALRGADRSDIEQTRMVLAADGIGGTLLAHEPWATWEIDPKAWIGISTTAVFWPAGLEADAIHMHIGYDGYVGLVRLCDDRVHLAAALRPVACREAGGPAALIERILLSCRRPTPIGLGQMRFRGTPELTRVRARLGGHRVLAIGDACGYVEPFTGEGIAWSISAAQEAGAILPEPDAPWPADLAARWGQRHARTVARRQNWCQRLKPIMHHPALAAAAIAVGRGVPLAARFLVSRAGQTRSPIPQGDAG